MIQFEKHTLSNGLRLIVHVDKTTPLAALNVMYDVGSRDEHPDKTGFAHLFEHLMFGGSKNIPDYDTPLQRVGGENNAFTSNDITNYYLTVPANNIETGFWLESDRMLELDFSERSLDVQRHVVIEEFKQRYISQPYGDMYGLVRESAYDVHPYRWQTIGKELSHIEHATLQDVKEFFYNYYAPNNAVLVVSGNVDPDHVLKLTEKWFGPVPFRDVPKRNIPVEPIQKKEKSLEVRKDVTSNALNIAFHSSGKLDENYYVTDLISDILSNGHSSRLYRNLVINQGLFGELDAFISDDTDPGLFTVTGKLIDGVSVEKAESAIWKELESLKNEHIKKSELQKVINKVEANLVYSEINFLNKAISLATFELLGNIDIINQQKERYREVTTERLHTVANSIFVKENSTTLHYLKK